jgi:deoxyribose-phosphate aldolase
MGITRKTKEVRDLAAYFHYGTLGIEKTTLDLRADIQKVLESGFIFKAYNVEMNLAALTKELLDGYMRIHVPISYPIGNMTLYKKQVDLDYCRNLGIDESCVCLNYGAIISHEYELIENEVKTLTEEFEDSVELAYVIQATLLTDSEIIDASRAIGYAGGSRIKLNTGYSWGTTPEEVALLRRVFGYKFDLHPSGNIITLKQVKQFMSLGVTNIHSLAAFEIIDEYIAERNAEFQSERP